MSWGFFINAFRQLRERSERNNKPPAKRVEDKKVKHKKHLFGKTELFKLPSIIEKVFFMAKEQNLAHTKWLCRYHVVFTPKYRRKAIYGQYREEIGQIIRQLCNYKGIEIIEGHMMVDHVHMLVMIPPKYSISSVMGYIKGKSSLMIFDRFSQLKYKYGNRRFWSVGYYVSTVGMNEATIRKYIREQDNADIMLDKMTSKEYADPFRPKPGKLL